MSMLSSLNVAASGMSAERTRLDIASSNLANAETTRGPDGQPYRRMDPVFSAVEHDDGTVGVQVASIRQDTSAPRPAYMPDHPDADANGYVQLPNVNPVHEVVNLMSAQRGYEANATAFETSKSLMQRALDIVK
ncbi:MAG TPA: flagellar basal body rod protein FlgC [Myxococcota bacterium]